VIRIASWLDFELIQGLLISASPPRKMPVTILLKALGFTSEQILRGSSRSTLPHHQEGHRFEVVLSACAGDRQTSPRRPKVIVQKDKRITVKHIAR
jgi:DNA-directed RNA polymerase subunit beta